MKLKKASAQASLEMAISITCVLILFLASIRLFFWFNQALVLRQEGYENTRVSAAAANRTTPLYVYDAAIPKLRLLNPGSGSGGSGGGGGGEPGDDTQTCYEACQDECEGLPYPERGLCLQDCHAACEEN